MTRDPVHPDPPPREPAVGDRLVRAPARDVTSRELLAGAEELRIHHQGSIYRLRLTRQDKLILTK